MTNFWMLAFTLFTVGILENFLASLNTGLRVRRSNWGCFITSVIIALTWCYIVGTVADNLTKVGLVIIYSIGYGIGDVFGLRFTEYLEHLAKNYGIKLKKWRSRYTRTVRRKRKKR